MSKTRFLAENLAIAMQFKSAVYFHFWFSKACLKDTTLSHCLGIVLKTLKSEILLHVGHV